MGHKALAAAGPGWPYETWKPGAPCQGRLLENRVVLSKGNVLSVYSPMTGGQAVFLPLSGEILSQAGSVLFDDLGSILFYDLHINPICLGELITIFALIELQFISTSQSISGKANDGDEELLTVIYGELESAVKLLMEYGAHQTGLRAKLLQADALEGLNKCDESRKLVDEVLAIAEQIGATDLVSIAKQYVAGETIFNMKRQLANSIPNSHFDIVRNLSDNEINDMARDILEAFNLPADRIKYIVKDLFWDRDDANEITSYCRHMLTKQDITHTLKPDTLYAYDPPRIIECGLLGYRSPQSGTDRTFLINEFKRSFCHMCKRKEI